MGGSWWQGWVPQARAQGGPWFRGSPLYSELHGGARRCLDVGEGGWSGNVSEEVTFPLIPTGRGQRVSRRKSTLGREQHRQRPWGWQVPCEDRSGPGAGERGMTVRWVAAGHAGL